MSEGGKEGVKDAGKEKEEETQRDAGTPRKRGRPRKGEGRKEVEGQASSSGGGASSWGKEEEDEEERAEARQPTPEKSRARGHTGIEFDKHRRCFRVRVRLSGAYKRVGNRKTMEEAIALFNDRTAAVLRRGDCHPLGPLCCSSSQHRRTPQLFCGKAMLPFGSHQARTQVRRSEKLNLLSVCSRGRSTSARASTADASGRARAGARRHATGQREREREISLLTTYWSESTC